jgi:hypothetical protein
MMGRGVFFRRRRFFSERRVKKINKKIKKKRERWVSYIRGCIYPLVRMKNSKMVPFCCFAAALSVQDALT